MNNILIIGTGGTIACTKGDDIHLDNPFKILDYVSSKGTSFHCVSPFSVLSENISINLWQQLIDCIATVDFSKYKGVIILHGSDTLAYTGALLGNIFQDKAIVLVAADKPIEDESSNGIENFQNAVDFIINGGNGVKISYNGISPAVATVSASENDQFFTTGQELGTIKNPTLHNRNILVIKPYVEINYDNYCLDNVDAVLHTMYHSATVPEVVKPFISKCKEKNIPFYFVTNKASADYESSRGIENIIFNSTVENAFARLLLTNDFDSDTISSNK
jgi:L-asparaginase